MPETAYTPIKLTKYQREEMGHLRDIAEGEVETIIGDVSTRADWQFDTDAYNALLAGEPLTDAQRQRLAEETRWHRDKLDTGDAEGRAYHRSMNNLLDKLGMPRD